MSKYNKVGIIGAGAWGSALASSFANAGMDVILWAIETEVVEQVNEAHENKLYLPGATLPKNIKATNNYKDLEEAEAILMVAPSQYTRSVLQGLRNNAEISKDTPFIFCSKGIENDTGKLLSQILEEEMSGSRVGILSGPSFADEVASGLPASLNIASQDRDLISSLMLSLQGSNLSLCPIDDIIGAQIAGALKNVFAIGCGIAKGLELGNNLHSALITQALKEMKSLSKALGGSEDSINELCGIGDTILTCSSDQSRNYSFGYEIGRGANPKDLLGQGVKVVEGAATAISVNMLCKKLGMALPICNIIHSIIYEGSAPKNLVESL